MTSKYKTCKNDIAFRIFCSEERLNIYVESPTASVEEVWCILCRKWKRLSSKEKREYECRAANHSASGDGGGDIISSCSNIDTDDIDFMSDSDEEGASGFLRTLHCVEKTIYPPDLIQYLICNNTDMDNDICMNLLKENSSK